VSSGRPLRGGALAIVDPESRRRLPDGRVGEIWLSGPHVADGYHNDPERTEATFRARIDGAGPRENGPWLRTGDLGFLSDGELFVTGRLKDLVIVNGRNVYPHDVEDVIRRNVDGVRDAALFAVPTEDGPEHVVAVLELASSHRRLISAAGANASGGPAAGTDTSGGVAELARAARVAVAQDCELSVNHVRIVLPGGIPKTTSGKTRYAQLRDEFHALGPAVRRSFLSTETLSTRQAAP
jgi:acyl-CoA synthetase (AMP-forming)/AMP-acid ligase II